MQPKIGLLTFCDNTNFGSFLQTYALYETVRTLGFDVELIDYRKNVPLYEWVKPRHFFSVLKKLGLPEGIEFFQTMQHTQAGFSRCISSNMRKSPAYTPQTISSCGRRYDVFLIGSDLVWDLRYAQDFTYMLDFVPEGTKKIAYAASYGYEHIPDDLKNSFVQYLNQFDEISVREENAESELSKLLTCPVSLVCDPTMLPPNSFWKEKTIDIEYKDSSFFLLYMFPSDIELRREIKRAARAEHCGIIEISKDEKDKYPSTPFEFISLIFHAKKVFTGSYHGLLFSIYFEKNFSFVRRHPSNRMDTLCDLLEIGARDMNSMSYQLDVAPDFSLIKTRENSFRKTSRKRLERLLEHVTQE